MEKKTAIRGQSGWGKYSRQFDRVVEYERKKTEMDRALRRQGKAQLDFPNPNTVDWLVYCLAKIANGGGVPEAARVLGVDTATIYNWLKKGIGGLAFQRVAELANRGNIPIHLLLHRMGPMELPNVNE